MAVTVLVVGGGRVGAALARRLAHEGHRVTVVEADPVRCTELVDLPADVRVVTGNGADPVVLEGVGIRTMHAIAAVTEDDARNLVIAALARFEFGVARTIARVVDPRHAWLFEPSLGVDVAVDQAEVLTRLIVEEMALGDVLTLVRLHRGDLALVEERVLDASHAAGRTIAELALSSSCALVAVLRDDEVLVARGSLRLRAGDDVLAITHASGAADLATALSG